MGRLFTWVQTGCAVALLAFALPAGAQITALRSSGGIIVYTNGEAPNGPFPGTTAESPVRSLAPGPQSERSRLEPLVRRMALRQHLDPRFVAALIRVESDWNPRAISSKGAVGLMQLTPATSRQFGVHNAFDPSENVRAGTAYLAKLVGLFDGNLRKVLAAYYAGPEAVSRLAGVPAAATGYVRRVLNFYFEAGPARLSAQTGPEKIYETVDRQGRLVFTNQ